MGWSLGYRWDRDWHRLGTISGLKWVIDGTSSGLQWDKLGTSSGLYWDKVGTNNFFKNMVIIWLKSGRKKLFFLKVKKE